MFCKNKRGRTKFQRYKSSRNRKLPSKNSYALAEWKYPFHQTLRVRNGNAICLKKNNVFWCWKSLQELSWFYLLQI